MYEKKNADGSRTMTGYSLKFYYDERQEFADAYRTYVSDEKAHEVMAWLRSEFPVIEKVTLEVKRLKGYSLAGRYCYNRYSGKPPAIVLNNRWGVALGTLCHEVAHALDAVERRKSKHDRYLYNILRMVVERVTARGFVAHRKPDLAVYLWDDNAVVEAIVGRVAKKHGIIGGGVHD